MMAAGFEYFDSTQSGAPVLTGQVGKMALLLDWVLVSKGGWDVAFTGTNLRAYRSQTGNRFYLRLDDTQALYARLRAYRAMTAVSTGTSQFPNNTQASNINTWGVRKGYANDATARRYWGVRTNRWLVMFVEPTDLVQVGVFYRSFIAFGDFPSLCESDSHNTAMIGASDQLNVYYNTLNDTTVGPLNPVYSYSQSSVFSALSGTPNGAVVSPLCGLHAPYKGSNEAYKGALALTERLSFGPLLLGCTNSVNVPNNGAFPRGRFPNVSMLYGSAGDAADPQLPAQDLVPFTIGSRQFLPLMTQSNGVSIIGDCYLLEMTDTDGAL